MTHKISPDGFADARDARSRVAWSSSDEPVGPPPPMLQKAERKNNPPQRTSNQLGRLLLLSQGLGRHIRTDSDSWVKAVFTYIDKVQELGLPLLFGVVAALLMKNFAASVYDYYFTSDRCPPNYGHDDHDGGGDGDGSDDHHHRNRRELAGNGDDGHGCLENRWQMMDCPVAGHHVTLHFFANDIIMCFHFALATKALTEAVLPGGSLNPPSKAVNPIITTVGGALVPILVFFALLEIFIAVL